MAIYSIYVQHGARRPTYMTVYLIRLKSVLCFCHTHGSVDVGIAHRVCFHLHLPVVGESGASCHTGIVTMATSQ